MKIKICGLQTKVAVDTAVESGATHLGFVLSKSRRQISAERIAEITIDVPATVKKVGVCVNEPLEFVQEAVKIAGLDLAQLHGDEDMTYIRKLNLPVIKAVSSLAQIVQYDSGVILLLDSPKGGSGQTFDWDSISSDAIKLPFFVAGGLKPDNVAAAIAAFPTAYGVDVSSGVETDGAKDLGKIRDFILNANSAHSAQLLAEFLRITRRLNEVQIVPYLLGSLAVELITGFLTNSDDIDIQLRAADFENFDFLSKLMMSLGYELINLHEHKFARGSLQVGFASVESLKTYAGIDYYELKIGNGPERFYLPTIAQNIKIYEAAMKDSWRNNKKKDKVILEKLKTYDQL